MVGQLRQEQFDNIIFGDEGQGYQLMNVEEFLSSSQVVPLLLDTSVFREFPILVLCFTGLVS
ncbi:7%2C8-dihydro-8-oxoguanine-triphosphatase [Streptococcus pneumoniae]|nr:7%2C8-dihydro-8-oxoguanine-triphosphatase [Streptococcus pneumoniae]